MNIYPPRKDLQIAWSHQGVYLISWGGLLQTVNFGRTNVANFDLDIVLWKCSGYIFITDLK